MNPNLSSLSLAQLSDLTGRSYRTIKRKLEKLEPLEVTDNAMFYNPRQALPLIFDFGAQPNEDQPDLTKERARFERARAEKTEIEVSLLRGKIVKADDVERTWMDMVGAFRGKMLSLPTKVALPAHNAESPAEVEDLVREEINEALSELSEYRISSSSGSSNEDS